jgi:polysaccharide deacetylase family protein (PEP-CTERM system associated)
MSAQDNTLSTSCQSGVAKPVIINAMSVDVEDYFQVAAFEKQIPIEQWSNWPCRVEANTDRLLALFEKNAVHGTFFILGWVATRYPDLVRRIVAGGHEVASHGMNHVRIFRQSPEQFRGDALTSKQLLEDISGQKVTGYRASTYSIGPDTLWALDILKEVGYSYSSSIYPVHHDLYGIPDAPRFPFYPRDGVLAGERGILEIPITTALLYKRRIPCGGGGYFRLFPLALSRWAWRRVNSIDGEPGVFYCHPWEFDPEQPRIPDISLKTRFRHYLNLAKMESRLQGMLSSFQWQRMDRVYSRQIAGEGEG